MPQNNSNKSVLRLPQDAKLPPIIREIVSNAPASRKVPAFIASLAPLCAMCPRVRLNYYYDSRPSALLLQVIIEGPQSSGKSFAADIESLIMDPTLKARDKEMRRLEQEYREKKRRRRANDKLEEEPQTTVRVVPPTISKTVLTKRADFCEKVLGDSMTFWMFAEELAQVTDAGKNGYSNLRTIMRSAYDLGSLFGIDFASDNSYSAIVDINICSMFCATPSAIDDYFDKKAIEGGNITRTVLCKLDEDMGEEGAIFKPYSNKQQARIKDMLDRLLHATYNEDGTLQPTVQLDMSWLDKDVVKFIKNKGQEAVVSGSQALDVFRKRASVSAFRIAALCYFLYRLTMHDAKCTGGHAGEVTAAYPEMSESTMRRYARQIYQFMADYILTSMLERWGKQFEDLVTKRNQANATNNKPRLFDLLPQTFTRDALKQLVMQQGIVCPPRVFVYKWRKFGLIVDVNENTYKKIDK